MHGGDPDQPASAGVKSEDNKTDTALSDDTKLNILRNKPLLSVEDCHARIIEAR